MRRTRGICPPIWVNPPHTGSRRRLILFWPLFLFLTSIISDRVSVISFPLSGKMDGDHRLDLLLIPFSSIKGKKGSWGPRAKPPNKFGRRSEHLSITSFLGLRTTDLGLLASALTPISVTRTKVGESRGSFFVAREGPGVVGEIRKLMHQVKSKLCDQSLLTCHQSLFTRHQSFITCHQLFPSKAEPPMSEQVG